MILGWLLGIAPSAAQVMSRPTPAPDRTAAASSWYTSRAPIFVSGAYYELAGASVFFDPNTMVPIARLDGVPVYADVTLEPYSVVFVPIGRGLVQPYERRRSGDLAGTTGSRAPSFPVALGDSRDSRPPGDEIENAVRPEVDEPGPTGTSYARERALSALALPGHIWTVLPPEDSRGIWIPFEGHIWTSAGRAEPFDATRLMQSGSYAGFPVYRAADRADVVFVPAVEGGLMTPYRRTQQIAP